MFLSPAQGLRYLHSGISGNGAGGVGGKVGAGRTVLRSMFFVESFMCVDGFPKNLIRKVNPVFCLNVAPNREIGMFWACFYQCGLGWLEGWSEMVGDGGRRWSEVGRRVGRWSGGGREVGGNWSAVVVWRLQPGSKGVVRFELAVA